ncbi:unnamed protein product [Bursaphelenchus xylophilus]|uniref:(pine wood nematode) hypothetical protein n=1 Tax=Bursaphelenchus xylophilus TaxID=6326 RepID=A0A1I7RQ18_BURXY|nr:unnamed protein product [Bursaphelenchus xylophilus]CAG9096999.1 unnamed protein product [Bursaphelenchus xylophilus]
MGSALPCVLGLVIMTNLVFELGLYAAPTGCRGCRGNCSSSYTISNNLTSNYSVNETEMGMSDDNETLIQLIDQDTNSRHKRASTVEKKPCDGHRFQLELILIPMSIFMIPVALGCVLFCVCFCGPKETRGKLPEKMWGIKLASQNQKRKRHDTEDELDYGDGYVQRKDSKKTRFATNVLVIERRRESAITVGSSSPKPLPAMPDDKKITRFNQKVDVIEEDTIQTTRL